MERWSLQVEERSSLDFYLLLVRSARLKKLVELKEQQRLLDWLIMSLGMTYLSWSLQYWTSSFLAGLLMSPNIF